MPRIPTRTEPYASPARQQRHFKAKRDQILRALGKAAYINGSHFAIMWVSARGDVETYASEAFQNRLGGWFGKGGSGEEMEGIAAEARGLVLGARAGEDMEKRREESWDFEEDDESRGDVEDDVFLDVTKGRVPDMDSVLDQAETTKGKGKRPAPLNTAIANQHFLRTRIDEPRSAPLFLTNLNPPRSSTPLLPRPTSLQPRPAGPTTPTLHIVLPDLTARTAFLHLRFAQLQQSVCKIVAKAWIKIIEPKKQTRCPYNKGESGKPSWWPEGVRHKEPDHLMKAERNTLLLTILRSEKVKVARLQLATAEVVALIRADKAALLMDVYRVAREEEGLRERGEEGERM
uniref:Subtelomeric hrmA-associated cluster protein AFUB-079030/YDR124W-like helical bundle domain-containing protein n=1 Tax=Kalmanozyma brasiliensis (strain GHG001) TaxID=1365824 RepID=V5EWZ4_KALBG